ncbi:MAG: acetyl-CoA hydrolase, partial [Aquamicrobium sp.]|nr:acetyl-CoA hydrolase [Aquamicrobium sp.]
DFTPQERRLLPALALLRERTATKGAAARTVLAALARGGDASHHREALERMDLAQPEGIAERLYRRLLVWALEETSGRETE